MPLWAAPRRSPGPRRRRSASATAKPSLVRGEGLEAVQAFGVVAAGGEDAVAFMGAAADAAAELVELGEAEALGFEDDHDGGVGNVDADFDDAGGDEGVEFAGAEAAHDVFFFVRLEPAVEQADGVGGQLFLPREVFLGGGFEVEGFRFRR